MDLHETWANLMSSLEVNGPKIKIVAGVVGLIGAGVLAAIEATKVKDDVTEEKKDFENIKRLRESKRNPREAIDVDEDYAKVVNQENVDKDICDCYSDRDYAKDVVGTSLRYGWKMAKRFGVPILVAGASAVLIFNGAHVLNDRLAGTTEALATITTAYSNYRKEVINRYGEAVDEEIRLGVKEQKITLEETVVDENGNEKVIKKQVKEKVVEDPNLKGHPYAFYVDEKCTQYMKNIVQMKMYAEAQQNFLNQQMRLGQRKWVTLSEIYDIFGRSQEEYTRDSLVVGIVRFDDKIRDNSDNYVDFRSQVVYRKNDEGKFLPYLLIDPNVEGSIYEKLPKALRYSNEEATV